MKTAKQHYVRRIRYTCTAVIVTNHGITKFSFGFAKKTLQNYKIPALVYGHTVYVLLHIICFHDATPLPAV